MMKNRRLLPILWMATILLVAFLLVSHAYNDVIITTRHGINFWKNLFDGDILDFYRLNVTQSGNRVYTYTQGCAYNILVYLVFAVWNIPLALLENFANIDVMNNVLCLAYAKLLPVTAMVITAGILCRIITFLGVPKENCGLLSYLYLSSSLMVSVVFIIAQYDTIGLIFQLLGFLAFLKGCRWKFILYFGIAFCFKYFSLVIFLPLLVLSEKRIITWIKCMLGMLLPLLVTKLPFIRGSTTADALFGEALGADLLEMILSYSLNFVNFFVVAYILILVWCYFHGSSERIHYEAVWAAFVSYAAFCGLCRLYPYWSVLLCPFVVLLIALTPQKLYINILLETVGQFALVFLNMLIYSWCYFGDTMRSMLPNLFFPDITSLGNISSAISLLSSASVVTRTLNSLFIGSMIALTYIAYPRGEKNNLRQWNNTEEIRDVLILRCVVVSVQCLLPILSFFI